MIYVFVIPAAYLWWMFGLLVLVNLDLGAGRWFAHIRKLPFVFKMLFCLITPFLSPLIIYYRLRYPRRFYSWPKNFKGE